MTPTTPRLRLRLSPTAESLIRGGHPWLFADSVRGQNRPGETGELAILYDRNDRFLALGLFDPDSPIRVRVLHAGKPQTIDEGWWEERLKAAVARRAGCLDAETTACRLVHGESDGWPGLVLDRYDKACVLKIYTAAWLPRLEELIPLIQRVVVPESIVLRLSRNLHDAAAAKFHRVDGQVILHPPGVDATHAASALADQHFLESGIAFAADLIRGQKTGFFLDQRENRWRVGELAAGRDVLNAFSFSGGFSLYAARGGAKSVTDLDLSEHALAAARRNFEINASTPSIARCRHVTVQADAFTWLESSPAAAFDLAILDPPSLARREVERSRAIQAYGRLAAAGLRILRPDSILVAASCSAHVSAAEFFESVLAAARESGRSIHELERTAHPADHPAGFPEAHYLKCIYLAVDPGARAPQAR